MSKKAVAGVLEHSGKILLGRKNPLSQSKLAGMWMIPGEKRNEGENDYDALYRMVKEELGWKKEDLRIVRYLGETISPTTKIPVLWYLAYSSNPILRPSDDLVDAIWVPKREVQIKIGPRYDEFPVKVRDYMRS